MLWLLSSTVVSPKDACILAHIQDIPGQRVSIDQASDDAHQQALIEMGDM
jgi:hypothetical protein